MIDSTNHAPITVLTGGAVGPYVMVPLHQLEVVKSILAENQIPFWVDSQVISLNGKPEVAVVNFGRLVSAAQVQRLLDAIS